MGTGCCGMFGSLFVLRSLLLRFALFAVGRFAFGRPVVCRGMFGVFLVF